MCHVCVYKCVCVCVCEIVNKREICEEKNMMWGFLTVRNLGPLSLNLRMAYVWPTTHQLWPIMKDCQPG